MRSTNLIPVLFLILAGLILSGCNGVNQSADNEDVIDEQELAVLNDEYANFTAGTMDSIDADVLFSINWRNIFYPPQNMEVFRSHIFAVAPDQDTSLTGPAHWGYDMGTVTLNYQDGDIDLNKTETRNGGFFYELGHRKPGGRGGPDGPRGHHGSEDISSSDTVTIPYYPNSTYKFNVTGSGVIAAATVQATSPGELLTITSHAKDDSIDSANNLIVTWSGGESSEPVIIALKPGFHKRNHDDRKGGKKGGKHGRGNHGDEYSQDGDPDQSFGGPRLKHHMFDEFALRYYVENNT
jgi:hypothetical protein